MILIISLAGAFLFFSKAFAASLIISEVYPNPNDGENEWIEIYNNSDLDLDLNNFAIKDNTKNLASLDSFILASQKYYLLSKGKDFSFTLNNDIDTVFLIEEDQVIDSLSYGQNNNQIKAPLKGYSINFDQKKLSYYLALPTPGRGNERTLYSKKLKVSELFPWPNDSSQEEFIEIYNFDDNSINLKFWSVCDLANCYQIPSDLIIEPSKYIVITYSESKLYLNNDLEKISLISPDSEIIDEVEYSNAQKNLSYSQFDNGWQWTNKMTKGEINVLEVNSIALDDISIISISEAKKIENGQKVTISGHVSVLPEKFSKQFFYIQDQTGGIQIYKYDGNFPKLDSGNEIIVSGEISESNAEKRLKVNSIVIKNSKLVLIEPKETSIKEIDSDDEGIVVKVIGRVSQKTTNKLVLEQQGSVIEVYAKALTNITFKHIKKGSTISIVGINTRYNNRYRILPISQENVKILSSETLPQAGFESGFLVLIFSALLSLIWNLFQKVKKILKCLPKNWLVMLRLAISLLCMAIWEPVKQLFLKLSLRH